MTSKNEFCVTGGSGFIGTRLCESFAKDNQTFRIIDLKKSRSFPSETHIGDIRDPQSFSNAIKGNVIFHLAAVHRDDIRPLSLYDETNVTGTKNVCNAAEMNGIETIIFTSSVAIYGFAPADSGENEKPDPFNDYGRTKFEAEDVLREWQANDPEKRTLVIIRPTVVFGEGNRGNVFNLLKQIASGSFLMIGAGKNRKSVAYVGNVVAFLRHCVSLETGVHIYNYVDKPDFEMNELVRLVRKTLKGKDNVGIRLPQWIGLLTGYGFDVVSRITGRKFAISSIRIKKFTSTTTFSSAAHQIKGFVAPTPLDKAFARTLDNEFLAKPSNAEEFFTE